MHYKRPSYRKNKQSGFVEGYTFKKVENLTLEIEVNVGGWVKMPQSDNHRVVIIKRGLGTAKINNYPNRIKEGLILDVPAGLDDVELYGQFECLCVEFKNVKEGKIKTNKQGKEEGWVTLASSKNDRLLIVKEGAGSYRVNDKIIRLEEGNVLELADTDSIELNGNIEYFFVEHKAK